MPLDQTSGAGANAPYEYMGTTLLSQQPPTLPGFSENRIPNWWQLLYTHQESRLSGLRSWRWTWWSTWMALAEFMLPRRAKYFVTANQYNRGNYLNNSIIDSTATLAIQTCASGLWTGLTNPSRPWFKIENALAWNHVDAAGLEWMEDTEKRIFTLFAQSNLYDILAQAFQDVVVFGSAPIIIYEDAQDGIRGYLPCAGEYFLGVGARLDVDTLYREFTYTIAQIVEQFRLVNCPQAVRDLWAQQGAAVDTEFVVCHAIEPNFALNDKGQTGRPVNVLSGKFKFRESYWLKGVVADKPLSMRGFNDKPFVVMRWSTVSNDAYGRSNGMDALGDVKQIQQETNRKAEFIEKGVRPPMIADPELKNEPASIIPGNITYVNTVNGKKGFEPAYEVRAEWLQHLQLDIEKVAARIKECFFIPQFMAITQMQGVQPRNELELTKRDLERLQLLGPFITKFETDCASPLIKRVYGIMQRKGMLKPMPPSLKGIPLKISYTSMMRMAQKAAESVALKDFAQSIGVASLAAKQSGVPDPARIVNWDKWARRMAEVTSTPLDLLWTEDEVKQHDQIRMDEIKLQKQQEQASQLTKPAVDAAKVLSNTPVSGGSMLNHLLTGSTAPGGGQ